MATVAIAQTIAAQSAQIRFAVNAKKDGGSENRGASNQYSARNGARNAAMNIKALQTQNIAIRACYQATAKCVNTITDENIRRRMRNERNARSAPALQVVRQAV